MKSLSFKFENQTVTMSADGIEAGFIKLAGEEIEYIDIEPQYRGMGFYKMLLIAALKMSGKQVLYSMNRNNYSNPAYEHWLNDAELTETQLVCISLDKSGEGITFVKI